MGKELKDMTLFEIGDDLLEIYGLIEDLDGDVTDEVIDQTIDKWLTANKEALGDKLEGYGWLIKRMAADAKIKAAKAANYKAEYDRLKATAASRENTVTRLKKRLLEFFEIHDMKTVETDSFKFNRQGNGGEKPLTVAKSVEDDIENSGLPAKYIKMIPTLDTTLLRAVLESDDEKAKAELVGLVTLEERGEHIRIY